MGYIWIAGQQAEGWPQGWINLGYTTDNEPFTATPPSEGRPTVTVTFHGLILVPCVTCHAPAAHPFPASWRADLFAVTLEPDRPPTRYITPHLADCTQPPLSGDEVDADGRTIMRQLTVDGPAVADLRPDGW